MNNRNRFLKCIGEVKHIFVRVARLIFPPFDIFCLNYFARQMGNTIIKVKPIAFEEYCHNIDGKLTTIEREQSRIVYEPAYYGKTEGKEYYIKSRSIYIAELNNVMVLGGTGLALSGDKALTDICINDPDNRAKYISGPIRKANKKRFFLEVQPDIEMIDSAINLCGLAFSNYYHLTFEILSRYGYVKDYLNDNSIPVLIDEGIQKYTQFIDLVRCFLGERRVFFVPEHKRILCKHCVQPSMNTWMPLNVKRKNDFRITDNLIAKSAIANIREATNAYRREKDKRKVFISRKKASFSRVINEVEVAELFRQNGFDIICTEDLSYKEQVELFSLASCIVGASGAALTNLVYCNPGTVVGCIIPQKYEFCIYSSISYMVGCMTLYLDAEIVKPGRTISSDQYMVNLDECRGYIRKLEEMIIAGNYCAN